MAALTEPLMDSAMAPVQENPETKKGLGTIAESTKWITRYQLLMILGGILGLIIPIGAIIWFIIFICDLIIDGLNELSMSGYQFVKNKLKKPFGKIGIKVTVKKPKKIPHIMNIIWKAITGG